LVNCSKGVSNEYYLILFKGTVIFYDLYNYLRLFKELYLLWIKISIKFYDYGLLFNCSKGVSYEYYWYDLYNYWILFEELYFLWIGIATKFYDLFYEKFIFIIFYFNLFI